MFSGEVSPNGGVVLEGFGTSINSTSERKVWITRMGFKIMSKILPPGRTTKRTGLAVIRHYSRVIYNILGKKMMGNCACAVKLYFAAIYNAATKTILGTGFLEGQLSMADITPNSPQADSRVEAMNVTDVVIWLQKEGIPEVVLNAFEGLLANWEPASCACGYY